MPVGQEWTAMGPREWGQFRLKNRVDGYIPQFRHLELSTDGSSGHTARNSFTELGERSPGSILCVILFLPNEFEFS